jgi:hypothetical protein
MTEGAATGATMADWLALHGLTSALCAHVLDAVPEVAPVAVDRAAPVPCTPEEVWQACGAAALDRMPEAAAAVGVVLSDVRVDFAPDPARYPRAFTLHDDGRGLPYASIPWDGRLSDVLAVAHEFGHALQIVASAGRAMPPVTREVCAYLSEGWLAGAGARGLPGGLTGLHRQRLAARLAREAPVLRAALEDPGAGYAYRWNYPLAQGLALRCAVRHGDMVAWPVFAGRQPLPELIAALCP